MKRSLCQNRSVISLPTKTENLEVENIGLMKEGMNINTEGQGMKLFKDIEILWIFKILGDLHWYLILVLT